MVISFKKIKIFILCALAVTAVLVKTVPALGARNDESKYIRCTAISEELSDSFSGFGIPEDANELIDNEKKPFSIGGKGGDMVELDGKTHYRTLLPYGIDYLSLYFDLQKETEVEESTAYEAGGEDTTENVEDKKSGTELDSTFVIGVYVHGADSSAGLPANVTLEFTDEKGGKHFCTVSIRMGKPYVIYADMSDFKGILFEGVELVITHDKSAEESLTVITSLPAESAAASFGFLKANSLSAIVSHEGSIALTNDLLALGTDKSDVLIDIYPESTVSDTHVAYAAFGCSEGEGTVTAITGSGSHSDSLHSIFSGSGLTLVRTIHNENAPMCFKFRSGNEEKLTLESISFTDTDEEVSMPGSFTTLSYKDGILSATGKLNSDTVNRYPDAKVGLYTAPSNSEGDVILLDEIKMTSRFSFSVSLEDYPHAHTDNTFFVAVMNEGDVIPVTKSRFVSAKSGTLPSENILALHGANPISVFESGVSDILIDVDLSKLITAASASSTTVSRGGYIYGIDSEYLRRLDSDINFYRSIGVSAYIKYICTEDMHSSRDGSWLTYQGVSDGELMLRADNRESLNIYPAVSAFLSQRYSNISSFVISSGVNSKDFTGINYRNIWNSVSDIALISRLVYAAASEFIPDVNVTISLAISGDNIYAPAETFAALFGERLLSIGEIPWSVMYCAEGDSPSVLCENMKSTARANGISAPLCFTVIYNAKDSDGDSTEAYEKFCNACTSSSVNKVFLSVENLTEDLSRESYSKLKNYGDEKDSFLFNSTAENGSFLENGSITGSASLHDFTNTYSPEGWNAGYGMASLQSAPVFGENHSRTLRCITDGNFPAGIFLCSFENAVNLADAPIAEFVFDLEAASDSQIVFVFGGGSKRAEFSLGEAAAYESADGMLHAVCDLSGYSSASDIEYVAVIIYSSDSVTFELSKVNVHSKTLDSQSVAGLIADTSDESDTEVMSQETKVAIAVGVLVMTAASARIATVLSRHDAKNKALSKASKKRRA